MMIINTFCSVPQLLGSLGSNRPAGGPAAFTAAEALASKRLKSSWDKVGLLASGLGLGEREIRDHRKWAAPPVRRSVPASDLGQPGAGHGQLDYNQRLLRPMLRTAGNSIVIVLLVLIILIQAGSLFYSNSSSACADSVSTADQILEETNTSLAQLSQDLESLVALPATDHDQVLRITLEVHAKTIALIGAQNAALLHVLLNCR